MKGYKSVKAEPDEWRRVGNDVIAVAVVSLIVSIFVHELGHAITLNLIGIPSTFFFEIRVAGPVFGVRAPIWPITIIEQVFVAAAGGGFAAIVFGLLGRFWRIECYIVAVSQACYGIFELMTWMLGIQAAGEFSIFIVFFAIVPIPTAIVANRIANRILKEVD